MNQMTSEERMYTRLLNNAGKHIAIRIVIQYANTEYNTNNIIIL